MNKKILLVLIVLLQSKTNCINRLQVFINNFNKGNLENIIRYYPTIDSDLQKIESQLNLENRHIDSILNNLESTKPTDDDDISEFTQNKTAIFQYLVSKLTNPERKGKILLKLITSNQTNQIKINEKIKYLLDNNADVNYINKYDWLSTPLLAAINKNDFELIKLLLDNGADVNQVDGPNNHSPLYWALRKNAIEIAKLLISRGSKDTEKTKLNLLNKTIQNNDEFNNASIKWFLENY